MWTQREKEEEGGMNGESRIDTYTHSLVEMRWL